MNDRYASHQSVDDQSQSQNGPPNLSQNASIGPKPSPLCSTFDHTDFNSNLDWFLEDAGSDDFLGAPDFFGLFGFNDNQTLSNPLMSAPQTAVPSARQSDAGDNANDDMDDAGNGDANDSVPALGGLLTPQPHETSISDNPWPVETPRPSQGHTALPPLGPEDQASDSFSKFCSLMPINDRTKHALQKCIMLPFEHSSTQTLGLERFPPNQTLDHCIDLYFAYFHPMLAIVHQPTFDPGKDLVVTLAMICIGACYTGYTGAKSFSIALSELIRKLLVFMAEQDRRFVRTASYLTAQLLQGTHGYCSGSERLFEISESCRSTLVHHAKCMGLFRYESQRTPRLGISLDEAWREWISEEGLRRLGWAVYKYDASVAYLHNNRPFLSTGDINLNLPGSADHWAAESAQAWSSLHPWCKACPPTSRLRPMIRLLFDGTMNPVEKIGDEEHRFIILLTLLRMLWTLKEIRSSPINDLVTPPCYDDGRRTLVQAIDQMTIPIVAASKNNTRAEMDRLVHRMQLVHISHVYGAGDLMNWLYPYLRHGPEAENARIRMKQWANENAQRTRDVAYHCAQMLALVRYYPSNRSLEPFLTFHAGVVLSCMATLLPEGSLLNQNSSIQLDLLDPGSGEVTNRQTGWVSYGGNEQISLLGVPDLASALGRQQVLDQTALLLKRQRVWGMARNLTKVVLALGARDTDGDIRDAAGPLQLFSATLSPSSFPHGT
ncbi:uncharacterized protein A1O5_08282 [Cladophialophora psammophila CBS 110553]|uniref:Xylanolytic transcriptional activator regulatory domain-containing protein n=1 Tax=Cladophialophora psammophila CBS 110553 TaxID=1182543 RepID=W9XDJ7_9EURO|nr:uncharacterized protein A1O5_08282 [Cladophialophora psammophila CBS 110553]EXJ68489.1 hypothetical protein A1O5_08282 [Cladophialophora psammophila CBS 110553]